MVEHFGLIQIEETCIYYEYDESTWFSRRPGSVVLWCEEIQDMISGIRILCEILVYTEIRFMCFLRILKLQVSDSKVYSF